MCKYSLKDIIVVVIWTMTFIGLAVFMEQANIEINVSTILSVVALTLSSIAFVKNVVYRR